ncbi:hypothetical protein HPHPH9_1533 [Helicobacter pylori Hp H-9]|nr:hypothetical protein HPHPH9_1533 [Helicobacter pylori Hp H-9]
MAYRSSSKHALKLIAFFDEKARKKRADFGMLFACYEFARV